VSVVDAPADGPSAMGDTGPGEAEGGDAAGAADATEAGGDAADAGADAADARPEGDAAGDASDGATNLCAGVICMASDACHVVGVCNPATGTCSNPAAIDGTTCDDGDACTQTDACQAGVCTGSNPVVCAPLDACHVAGSCHPATGQCSNPAAVNGTACNDGDACTQTDTCQSGVCTGSNPVVCTPLDACHVAGACHPLTGLCSNPAAVNGTTCNDGNACTQTDTCQAGVCTGSNPVVCTPLDQCHLAGTCTPASGCSNPNVTDGTACTSAAPCTFGATCSAGVCSGTACASGLCGAGLGAFTGAATPGWTYNGKAAYDGAANTVVLVDGLSAVESGSLVYNDPITVDAFTVAFDFKFTTTNGRADGIAFMLENDGKTALGGGYGGFGVLGLHGYGVELDIFDSGPCDPGNGNHAGVDLLSACGSNTGILGPVATSNDLYDGTLPGNGVGDIADGTWRTATVQLAAGQMSVTITGASGPVAVGNLQGVALPGFVSGTPYYFGFAAGSGSNGDASRAEIRNVAITFGSSRCL
jgi:hypothetical protein